MTRLLREARGWTQEHLAVVSGLSVRTIQRIEAGTPPSRESLLALAAAFDLAVVDLMDGPHVTIDHKKDPWPGLQIKVFKGGYQVGCCIELDSRRRTYKRLGFILLDIPEGEFFDRVVPGDPAVEMRYDDQGNLVEIIPHPNPQPTLVDGKPWDPWEHIVEDHYDAVVVLGHLNTVRRFQHELPKHWAVLTHFHEAAPLPEGVAWQDPDRHWRGTPPAGFSPSSPTT
jgi:transcriptional regulator with XRE-family HTH domain